MAGDGHRSRRRPAGGVDLGDIFRRYGPDFRQGRRLTRRQQKAFDDIAACRTASLGGHVDRCADCGHEEISYNSCGNRHCPKCQVAAQERWIASRLERVLNTHYFHLVFTLPSELRPLALVNQRSLYNLLFSSVSETLLELGRDPKYLGAELGLTSVLHTWNKELQYHPHLHTLATGGGLALDGESWVKARDNYLFPERVMADLFRGKFLAGLLKLRKKGALTFTGPAAELEHPIVFEDLLDRLRHKRWIVYAKRPFDGPQQVISYLGRYTHRVAISNHRLLELDDDHVTFRTKGTGSATLPVQEFLRRFTLHVLPHRFHKIRHYGIHGARAADTKWLRAKALLGALQPNDLPQAPPQATPSCPHCGSRHLVRYELLPLDGHRPGPIRPRGPPRRWVAA